MTGNGEVVSVPVRSPFPWETILRYLCDRSTPGLESIGQDRYLRTDADGGCSVAYHCSSATLQCSFSDPADAATGVSRLRRLFDTDHDPRPVTRVLQRSRILQPRMRNLPGMRAPGCWEPFELCVRVILGQQVSVRAAHTLMHRLAARCPAFRPDQLAQADLSGIGLTGSRLRTVRSLAEQVAGGNIRFACQPWKDVAERLRDLPGFGPWTIEYLAIRLGRDADAFPATDLGLLRTTGLTRPADLLRLAEAWRPYRAYAAMYLWAT